ncbi:MAG: hypothetical protein RMI91_12325 [Gemmatales bacterium]|nr:hypothetical protein [Gemmatales bacterium]MDW7995427.1 hypothetical protein [Gemmatales bacterium]
MYTSRSNLLRMEHLEDRSLPAGTVTTAFALGNLTITGDPQ